MNLDQKTLAELKEKLIAEKKRLEDELSRIAKPTGAPGDYETKFEDIGTDIDENASEVEQYTDNLALEDTLEKQLKEVNEALGRMKKGTYGICENCKQEINPDRLRAYPAAMICIQCE
jgi:RNA polymerase-binding transcription factor DksA